MTEQFNHGGNVAYFAKLLNISEDKIIDYSANINPLGCPPLLQQAIVQDFQAVTRYPDPSYHQLLDQLADYYGVAQEQLILGNGAVELIYLLLNFYRPARILITSPTFSEYALAATSVGAEVETVYLQEGAEWDLPMEQVISRLPQCQMVFICNPNNPTGNLFSKEQLLELASHCEKAKVMLVIDESFMDFLPPTAKCSLADQVTENPYLFVLASLTKILGVPGLRIGFGLGNRELITKLGRSKDPWNVNCFAELAARVGLADKDYLANTRALIATEKEYLYEGLKKFPGVKPYLPTVNFILAKLVDKSLTAPLLAEKLRAHHILIRDCSNFPGLSSDYFRLAVKDRLNNQQLLTILAEVLMEGDEDY